MLLLPLVVSFVVALAITPAILRHLETEGFTRANWRGRELPFPAGVVVVAAVVVSLVPLVLLERLGDTMYVAPVAVGAIVYLLGVALLGLIDDLLAGGSRGWRGHGRALLRGQFNTGVLKAVGALGLAMYALGWVAIQDDGEFALAVVLVVVTTNLFNLLDLRPGRAVKAFVLLAAALTIAAWDVGGLEILGLFAAPVLVVGFYDLRERAMLGDTGSNLIGGLAGLWLVVTLDPLGQAIALAAVLALTVYGEFRSLSALIERTPLLRQIDSIGRNGQHA